MLLAENPKILYSLGHHTQSIGVIAMGKCSCVRRSGDEKLGPPENEPERMLAQVGGRLNGWRVGRRPLERHAHTVGRAGKGAPERGSTPAQPPDQAGGVPAADRKSTRLN